MRPLIGISPELTAGGDPRKCAAGYQLTLYPNYAEAVERAGGAPVVITPQTDPSVLARLDGWLISGGRDIDAAHFGQEPHPVNDTMVEARYVSERERFAAAPADLPVLGICLGSQLINVFRGGSLHQHLVDLGRPGHDSGELQTYRVDPTSKLGEILEADSAVGPTYHHQGLDRLGEGLRAVAWHGDGTIEAIEDPERPWLIAVQWHPERALDSETSQKLFRVFVEAARKEKSRAS